MIPNYNEYERNNEIYSCSIQIAHDIFENVSKWKGRN